MNCFYLNTFYSVLTFLYFYRNTIIFYTNNFIPIFILILIIIMIIFVIIVFAIVIIISSFSMLLTFIFLVFTILFYLCIYQIFLNFKQMTWPNIVQSWRYRHRDCISVFDGNFEHYLLNLFFWRSSFEVTMLYFALDSYFFYSVFFI